MSYESFPQNMVSSSAPPISLLFFDNIVHKETLKKNTDEIVFEKPVKIYQIRFIRSGSLAHHNLKYVKNSTQLDSIKAFEIFYKDLLKPKARFSLLVKTHMLNEKPQTVDTIIPIESGIITDRLVMRGEYSRFTLCIYGEVCEKGPPENEDKYQFFKNDIPLEFLESDNERKLALQYKSEIICEIPHMNLSNSHSIISNIFQKGNFHILTDNIRPNLIFEDENDNEKISQDEFIKGIEKLTSYLNSFNAGEIKIHNTSEYLNKLQNLSKFINELLRRNHGEIFSLAQFEDLHSVYRKIPLSTVNICLEALLKKYDYLSEVFQALHLAKSFLNSYDHAVAFVEGDGLERIYSVFQNIKQEKNSFVFSNIKLLALEVINMSLSYDCACQRFLEFEITKIDNDILASQYEYFWNTVEKQGGHSSDEKKEKKSKSRSRSRSKKRSRKSKKEKKSKKSRNKNKSKKNKKKKEKEESSSDSESQSSESSSRKRKSKSKSKRKKIDEMILLKRGYQMIFGLFNKSQNVKIYYASKQILHKVSLYIYLEKIEGIIHTSILKDLGALNLLNENESNLPEINQTLFKLNNNLEIISNLLKNLLPAIKTQTLFNARIETKMMKFHNCVTKNAFKPYINEITQYSNLSFVLLHDTHLVNNGMCQFLIKMNMLPSFFILLSNEYIRQSPLFFKLFKQIYQILAHLLCSKGGIFYFIQNQSFLKLLFQVMQLFQNSLKKHEAGSEKIDTKSLFDENNLGCCFEQWALDSDSFVSSEFHEGSQMKDENLQEIKIGVFTRQITDILKYSISIINLINTICVKILANCIDENMVILLSDLANLCRKNKLANFACRKIFANDDLFNILLFIAMVKSYEEFLLKEAEINLVCQILYDMAIEDDGRLFIPNAKKILEVLEKLKSYKQKSENADKEKDDLNSNANEDETPEYKPLYLLKNYLDPIGMFEKEGFVKLIKDFTNRLKYSTPKLDLKKKTPETLAKNKTQKGSLASLKEDVLFLGDFQTVDSNLIFFHSSLRLFNILASYNKNIFVIFYENDFVSVLIIFLQKISNILSLIVSEKKEYQLLINQILNPNKLLDSYLQTVIQCVSLLNQRIQYRTGSDEHKDYSNSELFSVYFELYSSLFVLTSSDSNFAHLNVSSSPLNKEKLIKLQDLILNGISIWIEFPNSQELLVHFLYEKAFTELYKRPAALYLLASVIKFGSLSDKACKEGFLKLLKPLSPKDEIAKREKIAATLTPNEKILDVVMSRNFFWDSKFMIYGSLHFIEAVISLQDYDIVLGVYSVFEKNLKAIYDEIKGDMQEENLIQIQKKKINSDKLLLFKEIGKILFLMKKCLLSSCFTSTVVMRDFLKVLLPIVQALEDEVNLIVVTGSNLSYLSELFLLRNDILAFLEIICDYEYSISGLMENYKESYYLVEDIPTVSKHQDICKFLSNFLDFPHLFLRKFVLEHEKIPTPSKMSRKASTNSESNPKNVRKDSETIGVDPNFNYSDDNILAICKSINYSLKIITKMAKNIIGQNVLLYTDYLKIIPLKPSPAVNLGEIFLAIIKILSLEKVPFNNINKIYYQVYKILENMLFGLIYLTIVPNPNLGAGLSFYNSEKRKNALKTFLLDKNKNSENHQNLMKAMTSIFLSHSIKNPASASLLDYFSVLNSIIEQKSKTFSDFLSRNLYKKDESNFIYGKKILKKLHISSLELNLLIGFLINNDFKKDIDKNIELPNPRDLSLKFEDLNKFMIEKKHLKTSKASVQQIETAGTVNYTDKIIKTIHKKLEKSIFELIYEEKKEFWKESRLGILNSLNFSLNLPNTSSFSCPLFTEMNLKYINLDNITAKNILHEKKEENLISPFICIKYNSKTHFIQNLLRAMFSTQSEFVSLVTPYPKKFIIQYSHYTQKPIDISISLSTKKKPVENKFTENPLTKPISYIPQANQPVQTSYVASNQQKKPAQSPATFTPPARNIQSQLGRPPSTHVDIFEKNKISIKPDLPTMEIENKEKDPQMNPIQSDPVIRTPSPNKIKEHHLPAQDELVYAQYPSNQSSQGRYSISQFNQEPNQIKNMGSSIQMNQMNPNFSRGRIDAPKVPVQQSLMNDQKTQPPSQPLSQMPMPQRMQNNQFNNQVQTMQTPLDYSKSRELPNMADNMSNMQKSMPPASNIAVMQGKSMGAQMNTATPQMQSGYQNPQSLQTQNQGNPAMMANQKIPPFMHNNPNYYERSNAQGFVNPQMYQEEMNPGYLGQNMNSYMGGQNMYMRQQPQMQNPQNFQQMQGQNSNFYGGGVNPSPQGYNPMGGYQMQSGYGGSSMGQQQGGGKAMGISPQQSLPASTMSHEDRKMLMEKIKNMNWKDRPSEMGPTHQPQQNQQPMGMGGEGGQHMPRMEEGMGMARTQSGGSSISVGNELSNHDRLLLKEINQLQSSNDPRKNQKLKQILKENPSIAEYLKNKLSSKK